jgi:predicted adenine nucleotide alpha hydrolase (AANH) superfamily ATPase
MWRETTRLRSILNRGYIQKVEDLKVALHICCAVCAAGAAERLLKECHVVLGYFYNPNLYPKEEYLLRLENAQIVARQLGFSIIEGPSNFSDWVKAMVGLENEPEGGGRCPVCIKFRLERTYRFMQESGCEAFTTTLTMGSSKPDILISRLGHEAGGGAFLERDFKKKAGIERTAELAEKWGLYRQHYCGCQYSLKDMETRPKMLRNPIIQPGKET